jgi:hypothetical protein
MLISPPLRHIGVPWHKKCIEFDRSGRQWNGGVLKLFVRIDMTTASLILFICWLILLLIALSIAEKVLLDAQKEIELCKQELKKCEKLRKELERK